MDLRFAALFHFDGILIVLSEICTLAYEWFLHHKYGSSVGIVLGLPIFFGICAVACFSTLERPLGCLTTNSPSFSLRGRPPPPFGCSIVLRLTHIYYNMVLYFAYDRHQEIELGNCIQNYVNNHVNKFQITPVKYI